MTTPQHPEHCTVLLAGRSGSGKTTAAEFLEKHFGQKQLQSFTTRPPRFPDEPGHTFVSEEEFSHYTMVAETTINGFRYGATAESVRNADIYVIDIPGILKLKQKYHGNTKIIFLDIGVFQSVRRMLERGDSPGKVFKRAWHDLFAFSKKSREKIGGTVIDARHASVEEIAREIMQQKRVHETLLSLSIDTDSRDLE